jgi:hypothetical protein
VGSFFFAAGAFFCRLFLAGDSSSRLDISLSDTSSFLARGGVFAFFAGGTAGSASLSSSSSMTVFAFLVEVFGASSSSSESSSTTFFVRRAGFFAGSLSASDSSSDSSSSEDAVFLRFCGCFFGTTAFRLGPCLLSAFESSFLAWTMGFEAFGADFTGSGSGSSPQYWSYEVVSQVTTSSGSQCTYYCIHDGILALLLPIGPFQQTIW